MALVDKSRGAGKTFPRNVKLAVGETVAGHVIGFEESSKYPGSFFILLKTANGETVSVSANGNLKYRHKDGDIAVGQATVITRNPDRMGKKSKKMTADYFLAQDADDTIAVEASELDAAGITSDVAAPGATSIKARAAKLAAQVK